MPRIPGANDHQTAFLRAFIRHPDGPPPELWPRPVKLRRSPPQTRLPPRLQLHPPGPALPADLRVAYAAANAASELIIDHETRDSEKRPASPGAGAPV